MRLGRAHDRLVSRPGVDAGDPPAIEDQAVERGTIRSAAIEVNEAPAVDHRPSTGHGSHVLALEGHHLAGPGVDHAFRRPNEHVHGRRHGKPPGDG